MIHPSKLGTAVAAALVLGACGGGGNGGISSAPPPTAGPSPTSTPTPSPTPAHSFSAPAPASAPAAPPFPQAVAGGPTIAAPGSAQLPLLQTVQVRSGSATVPVDAPGSITLNSSTQATMNIENAALGISRVPLTNRPQTVWYETSGSTVIRLDYSALDWTAFGDWMAHPKDAVTPSYNANFVMGFQTPGSAVPRTGSATYTGTTRGNADGVYLSGSASLQANFADRSIVGTLTGMEAGSWEEGYFPWNSVSLSASFAAGQSGFSGTTTAITAPGNAVALAAGATGSVVGSFFGPAAEEIGAVWTLFDGTKAATGSLGAKRP